MLKFENKNQTRSVRLYLSLAIFVGCFHVLSLASRYFVTQQFEPTSSTEGALLGLKPVIDIPARPGIRIEKHVGKNWQLWDRSSILGKSEWACNWQVYLPADPSLHRVALPVCLHPRERDRTVSGSIIDTGKWSDCDPLTSLLREEHEPVHLEIGANIGSCVLQVLGTTNATVYAFEPHPENLFRLTSTLMNLEPGMRDRVFLFPIALGDEQGESKIVMNKRNSGNAQVDQLGQVQPHGIPIPVERLDDILSIADTSAISLMKVDVQGFDCFVLKGGKKILTRTQKIVFEVEADQMSRLKGKCTPTLLVNYVKDSGFEISRLAIDGKDNGNPDDLPDFTSFRGRDAVDLVGRKTVRG